MFDEGIKAVIAGEADVAMASRKITHEESKEAKLKGLQLDEHLIGYGGIVIVTDKRNPLDELAIDNVRKIFTGQMVNWKDVNGKNQAITVFKSGDKHPGTLLFVENDVLGGVPLPGAPLHWLTFRLFLKKKSCRNTRIDRLRQNAGPFPGPASTVKLLMIKKDEHSPPVIPSRATIADGTYPLRRPYYLYNSAAAGQEVRSFVDFVARKGWGSPT